MLRNWVLLILLESQEMGRNVQSQSEGKGVREEKQRLCRKQPCRICCKASSSRGRLPCSHGQQLLEHQYCQVLLGATEVEVEDEVFSSRNSRNL